MLTFSLSLLLGQWPRATDEHVRAWTCKTEVMPAKGLGCCTLNMRMLPSQRIQGVHGSLYTCLSLCRFFLDSLMSKFLQLIHLPNFLSAKTSAQYILTYHCHSTHSRALVCSTCAYSHRACSSIISAGTQDLQYCQPWCLAFNPSEHMCLAAFRALSYSRVAELLLLF